MKAALVFTGSGPIVVLTTHDGLTDPDLVSRFAAKGIQKFLAFEVRVEAIKAKCQAHFDHVLEDIRLEDDLRVVDENGHRVLSAFSLREPGAARLRAVGRGLPKNRKPGAPRAARPAECRAPVCYSRTTRTTRRFAARALLPLPVSAGSVSP